MFGDLIRYAANRAVGGAVDSAARQATWGAAAIFLIGVGTVFSLIVVFWLLEAYYSATTAGLTIAALCFVVAGGLLMMPRLLNWMESKSKHEGDPVAETAAVVQEEVEEAVDYFGPIRVVASALMLGVGIARTIKR
jgi:hypothetical protein